MYDCGAVPVEMPDDAHHRQLWLVVLKRHSFGGPDLLPYKKGQMNNSYPFIKARENNIPAGMAVQWGNYTHINSQTGKQVTIHELIAFAKDYLEVDYIFWGTQEPYYSEKLIPFLHQGD